SQSRYPYGRMTMVPLAGPRSTSSALKTSSLYQAEKSSLWGVTPRSSRATNQRLDQYLRGHDSLMIHAGLVTDVFSYRQATMVLDDCLSWLPGRADRSIHAVVTDPPYGLVEYSIKQKAKLRSGRGGVWRIPPSYDGHQRSPLPRFTVLTKDDLEYLSVFFLNWARALRPKLVPGAHVLVASNPLVSPFVSQALGEAGLDRRGEIVRLVMTMRGGDRPKGAHEEFDDVSVMPRAQWEPWLLYREPIEAKTVADNLRKWKTGGLRRISPDQPFGDVIRSHPTGKIERNIAPHPSLKPQSFLRAVVRA